eukprot:4589501-Pyramimonas_sp.AAC.1
MKFAEVKDVMFDAVDRADALLAAYVNSGYDQGMGRSEAQNAGFSRGQATLPRLLRALRAWAKPEPGVALPPIRWGL